MIILCKLFQRERKEKKISALIFFLFRKCSEQVFFFLFLIRCAGVPLCVFALDASQNEKERKKRNKCNQENAKKKNDTEEIERVKFEDGVLISINKNREEKERKRKR